MPIDAKRAQYRESLRQEILDAAREMFVLDGYAATSIRRIADRAGCSPGILYHYFEDKEAIMAQLVRETFGKLTARMRAMVDDSAPPLDRLHRALRTYVEFGIEHPHHYAVLFGKPAHGDREKIAQVFQQDGMQCFDCLRRLCRESIEAGALRPELQDVEEVAQTLWAGAHGLTSVFTQTGFPVIERSRLIDRMADVLITGVRRK